MYDSIETQFLTIGSVRTRVLRAGKGPAILFLHGWGCNAETMIHTAKSLSQANTCYLIDLPGFGQTDIPDSAWQIADYATFVHAIVTELELETYHILAHSFGGRITFKLLSNPDYSNRIHKVLITGGAGMKPKRKPSFYFKKYTVKILKAPFLLLPGSLRERGLEWLRQTAIWKKLGSSDFRQLDGVMRQIFINTVTEFQESELPYISHEVFLLWGKNDDSTPVYQGERMEKLLPNSSLVLLENAGHYAFLDQPAQFNAIAKAYLQA